MAFAVLDDPAEIRTLGVGCAAAAGRIGAIVGPATAGALLSIALAENHIVTLCCVPIGIIILLLIMSHREQTIRNARAGRQARI
jgi:AAHS family 4-hydroxybenzoate transporter-like MFS transporter